VGRVAFDGFDDVGNEIGAALELDVDVRPGIGGLHVQAHEPVVDADDRQRNHGEDDQEDNQCHQSSPSVC
jgi:hypothetical protein